MTSVSVTPMNPRETRPLSLQLRQHGDCLIDRHGEPDAARPRADGGVDADDFAAGVDERPAAVAEVDRRVGLDVVVEARVEQLSTDEADDADRHGVDVAERVADGADPLADPQIVGVAQRRRRKVRRPVDPQQRDVGGRVGADDLGAKLRPSASVTVMRCAVSITWLFVRMKPVRSMRKPLPDPGRGVSSSRMASPVVRPGTGSAAATRAAAHSPTASMFTTAALMRSVTSAKFDHGGCGAADSGTRVIVRRRSRDGRLDAGPRFCPAGKRQPDQEGHRRAQYERDDGEASRHRQSAVERSAVIVAAQSQSSVNVVQSSTSSDFSTHYTFQKFRFREDCDAQRACLVEFAAGLCAGYQRRRLLADGAVTLAAQRLDRRLRLFAGHADSVPVSTYVLAAEWPRALVSRRRPALHVHARVAQPLDQLRDCAARRRTRSPRRPPPDRFPDTACSASSGASSIRSIVRKCRASVAGGLLADVPDAERVDQPRQIVAAAAIDLRDDVAADLPELPRPRAVGSRIARRHHQLLERSGVEMVQIGKVADEPTLEELIDERLAEALDVHRRARREVLQAAAKPGRAGRVRAAPHHFLLVPLQVALTHGAGRRHLPGLAAGRVLQAWS